MGTLQFRRGSTANLQNIIPAAGEPIWDKQLQKLKVGDGLNQYKDLPYVGDVSVDGSSIVLNENNLVSLFGFDDAIVGSAPIKSNDGKIEWSLIVTKDEVDNIKATVDAISDYIDTTLANELSTIEDELDRLDVRIDNLDGRVDDLDSRLDTVEDTLAQINPERIEEALETIEQVEDRLDDLQADVGDHENRITKLEQNSIDLDTDIFIIYGGSADSVIVEEHHWEDE